MKNYLKIGLTSLFAVGIVVLVASCFKNPVTGRSGLNLVDDQTINSMSAQQYNAFLAQNKTDNNSPNGQMVKKVGNNMSAAVAQYLSSKNQSNVISGYQWQFNYVTNKQANAFCMPGGRVVVFSGIMPAAKDETGLAVIMGHEIAHAVAKHGNERLSQGLAQQLGGVALSVAMSSKSAETQQLFSNVYGLGSTVGVMLPFSRTHETEADQMGLIFMALAGYDPNAAIGFWERMAQMNKAGGEPPEFLSTHPATTTRINNLKKFIPEAMKYYKPRK